MEIEKKKIESALCSKGFEKEESGHHYFHLIVEGKRVGVSTHTSHGSHHKTYGDSLLKKMKWQLRLDKAEQLKNLIDCPLTREGYLQILKEKKVY